MTTFEILENGNLKITLDWEGKVRLSELLEESNNEAMFIELIEDKLCNGYSLVNPEDIGALTESLIIADDSQDDNGKYSPDANFWYYNDYVVKSYLEDLNNNGYIIFNKA